MAVSKALIFKVLLWEGVMVLKELIFNSFYIGRCLLLRKISDFNCFFVGSMWWS